MKGWMDLLGKGQEVSKTCVTVFLFCQSSQSYKKVIKKRETNQLQEIQMATKRLKISSKTTTCSKYERFKTTTQKQNSYRKYNTWRLTTTTHYSKQLQKIQNIHRHKTATNYSKHDYRLKITTNRHSVTSQNDQDLFGSLAPMQDQWGAKNTSVPCVSYNKCMHLANVGILVEIVSFGCCVKYWSISNLFVFELIFT